MYSSNQGRTPCTWQLQAVMTMSIDENTMVRGRVPVSDTSPACVYWVQPPYLYCGTLILLVRHADARHAGWAGCVKHACVVWMGSLIGPLSMIHQWPIGRQVLAEAQCEVHPCLLYPCLQRGWTTTLLLRPGALVLGARIKSVMYCFQPCL